MEKILLVFLFFCAMQESFAFNSFKPKTEWISFNGSVPPALFYVVDSNGNRAGADSALTVNQFGQQGDNFHGLEEIPGSYTEQENIQNDQTNQPSKHTSWYVKIPDGGSQTYTINLIGETTGSTNVYIVTGKVSQFNSTQDVKVPILILSGATKQIEVNYNSSTLSASTTPVVGNDGLLNDIKSACSIGLIEPRECEFLTLKAEKIEKALDRKNDDEAVALLRSFLCNFGLLKGDGDDDRDDRNAIKEPAYGIIRSDVIALLKTLSKRDERFHFFDFDHIPF